MSRSRLQMLQPVYDLVCEAQGHLRDAHVGIPVGFIPPKGSDLAWMLEHFITAREQSLTSGFCTAYRENQPIHLAELRGCLEHDMRVVSMIFAGAPDSCIEPPEIDQDDPDWAPGIIEAAKDAQRCYACALAIVKVLAGYHPDEQQRIVPPAPEGVGHAVSSGP